MRTRIRRIWENDVAFRKTVQILLEKKKNCQVPSKEEWNILYSLIKNKEDDPILLEVNALTIENVKLNNKKKEDNEVINYEV